jgi:hypothetical protein
MAREETLTDALQESVLATLIFDDKHGAIISAQVRSEHFDDVYRDIAAETLKYRQQYKKAPGRTHLDDLISVTLSKKGKDGRIKRILFGLAEMESGLNGEYIANEVQTFIRKQKIKRTILEAGQRYDQGGPDMITEVETLFQTTLHARAETMDPGIFLNSASVLSFLDEDESDRSVPFGIRPWDKLGIKLEAKELCLMIGPKGSGKTWFCVHAGKQGLLQGERVLHVTIENKQKSIAKRYMQSLFAVARNKVAVPITKLEIDRYGRFKGMEAGIELMPEMSFTDTNIRKKLRAKIKAHGGRLGRLVVKDFPTGYLTIPILTAYLDFLESSHNFVPTMLIVDYLDLMRIVGEYRFGIRANVEGLRGLFQARNLIGVCPTHGGRKTILAKKTTSKDVAEDISKVNAADKVITFSQTSEEKDRKLARLTLEHSRETEDDQTVIVSQNYATGQYVMDAALFPSRMDDYFKEVGLAANPTEDEQDQDVDE